MVWLSSANRILELSLKGRIEPVFDVVVGSSWEVFSYLGPLVAKLFMSLNNFPIFLRSPLILLDIRVEMIVPSLATLFTDPSR